MTNTPKAIENGDIFDEYSGNFLNYHPVSLAIAVRDKLAIVGMTQKELADRSGMSQAHINKIVKVKLKSIPESTGRALKDALDLPEELDAHKPVAYVRTMEKLEQALLSGEVTENAWDLIDKFTDIVMTSVVPSFPSISYDVNQPLDYQAGPRTSGWGWYMRGLMNSVVNEGFRKHDHWNRFAVTRTTAVYQNNKLVKTGETYAEGALPYQEDVLKIISKVSNPRMGGAYDGFEIRDAAEQNAFERHEIRYWLYYQKVLSGNREIHAHMQFDEPYNSSDIERFTRAVDQFIINAEGER